MLVFSEEDALEHQRRAHELIQLQLFEPEDDEPGPSRTFLNSLRDVIKGMFEDKGAITNDDFDKAIKRARSSAGGKHSARKKKRSGEDASTSKWKDIVADWNGDPKALFDSDDPRPKLAKEDEVVAFAVGGGDLAKACGKCRFFGFDTCRLVEGTIEAADVCDLFRDRVEFSFDDDTDFHSITASSPDGKGGAIRASYAFLVPIEFAEVKDGAWIPYLPVPGEFESPRYGTIRITNERNHRFVENFRAGVYQEKLPVDAEHETKLSGAVAWITDMRQNSDGSVDAKVDWTPRGRKLMEGDSFKYFSPEFFDEWQDPATGDLYSDIAIGGALTTRPFFKEKALRPLVAAEGGIDALLDDEKRAHFVRKAKEAKVTKKTEKKSIFARLAAALKTSEGGEIGEEDLREELRAELATPKGEGDDESGNGEGDGEKPTGSESGIDGLPKEASERIMAAEVEAKKLREELALQRKETADLKEGVRATRLTEIVMGRSKESKHRWFGDVAEHVKTLGELADSAGEDSDVFKSVVKSNAAAAAQIEFAQTLKMKELGYQGTTDADGSPEQKVAAEARKIFAEQPDKFPTIEQARTHVWDAHPDWKEEAHRR